MFERYRGKGVAFLSVNVVWDNEGPAKKFVEEYRLPFPVGRDSDAVIGTLYGVEATPTSFFIGKDGTLVERLEGAAEDTKEIEITLERRLEKLLSG